MTEQEMNQMDPNVSDDDKLWAALAYVFTPLIPIILMLMDDKKNRPFIKAHSVQALVAGVAFILLTTITFGCGGILWFVFLFWAYKAYQGEYVEIPLISNLVKNQGWA